MTNISKGTLYDDISEKINEAINEFFNEITPKLLDKYEDILDKYVSRVIGQIEKYNNYVIIEETQSRELGLLTTDVYVRTDNKSEAYDLSLEVGKLLSETAMKQYPIVVNDICHAIVSFVRTYDILEDKVFVQWFLYNYYFSEENREKEPITPPLIYKEYSIKTIEDAVSKYIYPYSVFREELTDEIGEYVIREPDWRRYTVAYRVLMKILEENGIEIEYEDIDCIHDHVVIKYAGKRVELPVKCEEYKEEIKIEFDYNELKKYLKSIK